jgi:pimeloyl-ACP methyl ester carboxylesterase
VGEDILALIRELNAGPAIIVGTSMGGGAAIWAAVEAPELVRGMVMIDPFVDGDGNRLLAALLSIVFARPWGPSMWMKYYSSLYPTRKPADFAEYSSALHANIQQRGRMEAVVEMLRASKRASGERMPGVTQPALVLMGSKDPDFKNPEVEAKRVAQAVRGSYKIIENAGHYPQAEMPEIAAALILDFLNSVSRN